MNFVVLEINGDLKGREDILNTSGDFRAYSVSREEHHPVFESGKVT